MRLHDLRAPKGANRKTKRLGRGESSGQGKTSGKGNKGQLARTGKGKPGIGFEGGQMPMYRRMPKRGFNNIFAKRMAEVNLDVLAKHFGKGEVSLEALKEKHLVSRRAEGLRVLSRGELTGPLTIHAHHVSEKAREKIEKAGGKIVDLKFRAPGPKGDTTSA